MRTVHNYTAHIVTYNLTVEDLHTYYVLAGNIPVLVHNSACAVLPSVSADEFVVLGNRQNGDTRVALDWPNHEVLDLDKWSVDENDEFIRGVIRKRQKVYLATAVDDPYLERPSGRGESVYARELNQLLDAGYSFSSDGMHMLPPGE